MKTEEYTKKDIINRITSYPPIIYLAAVVIGLIVDAFIPIRLMPASVFLPLGFVLLFLSPLLILWARYSSYFSLRRGKIDEVRTEHFRGGPYKFSRHPIYLAQTFLVVGLGFLTNSIFVIAAALISFFIVHFFIIKREERILEQKYGEEYLEYKKSVRKWL